MACAGAAGGTALEYVGGSPMNKEARVTDHIQKVRESLKRASLTPSIEARTGHLWEAINHLAGALEATCRDGGGSHDE